MYVFQKAEIKIKITNVHLHLKCKEKAKTYIIVYYIKLSIYLHICVKLCYTNLNS